MKSIGDLLKEGARILIDSKIPSAQLDARLLMQDALQISHEQLLLKKNQPLDHSKEIKFLEFIKERASSKPLSYILGKKEFFSKDFIVNQHTLIPRPDTEIIVESCFKLFPKDQEIKILDLGTGSGCIAICLASHYPNSEVTATDISIKALETAKINSKRHKTKINFVHDRNFASTIKDKFDLIVSNPPYIPSDDIASLQKDVKNYEPMNALDGGNDGLDPYRIIISQAANLLHKDGKLVFEIGINQADDIIKIALEQNFKLHSKYSDLASIDRCLIFEQK